MTFWHKFETRQKPETRQGKTRTLLWKLTKTGPEPGPGSWNPCRTRTRLFETRCVTSFKSKLVNQCPPSSWNFFLWLMALGTPKIIHTDSQNLILRFIFVTQKMQQTLKKENLDSLKNLIQVNIFGIHVSFTDYFYNFSWHSDLY